MLPLKSILSLPCLNLSYARMIATKTSVKLVGGLDEALTREAADKNFTGKCHPGIVHNPVSVLPPPLQKAIFNLMIDTQIKVIEEEGVKFSRQLKARFDPSKSTEKRKWTPIEYTEHTCRVYLLSRMAADFAALNRVFGEFSKWAPNFIPKTIFDLGSGVGSVPWAALARWGKRLEEIYCVDASSEMLQLGAILMRGGVKNGQFILPQTYYRQFLPATANRQYDLVACAHSLFEFANLEARLDAVQNLWAKTNKYFVLVEQGSREGFKLIDEAKEFVLFTARKEGTPVHILAPCPHVEPCPRLLREGDRTPCNFQTRYMPFPNKRESQALKERFSFVIIGKGPKPTTLPQWPRIVREPISKSQHVVCRMCTPDAKLEEVIFTKSKDGTGAYLCSKNSEWGDLLPVTVYAKEFTVRDRTKKNGNESEEIQTLDDKIEK